MKTFMPLIFLLFSVAAQAALPTELPIWLTDDKAKNWAVNHLIEFMKDDEFYKIQSIKVERQFDEPNQCDSMHVSLVFDDPSCKGREVTLSVKAPHCNDMGCSLFAALTDCLPEGSSPQKLQKFMRR